jgi:hypothetical protein
MNFKNKTWKLHILFGMCITLAWGFWFDYSYSQWWVCLALTTWASTLLRQHFNIPDEGEITLCSPIHFNPIQQSREAAQ